MPCRTPGSDPAPGPHAEPAHGPWCRAPIYAGLVAEWRARGRTVPARSQVQWVSSFAGLAAGLRGDGEDPS
ncbi:hypothetical protein ACFV0T_14970 [Streptomyces sp. NPDC059582]|uniref:hypothetical protein n=1 Tax=Streptomyces sp. NPDC059582 TaxID=3346875 RepID=UPI00369F6C63